MTYPPPPPQYPPHPPSPAVPYATPLAAPDKDVEHLRLLTLFHYVGGGLMAAFSCMGLFHVFFGVMMLNDPSFFASNNPNQPPPPPFMGWMFLIMGGAFVLLGWTSAALTIASGRMIRQRRAWLFSIIIAGINCLWMPIGTILGVFTFIVPTRPSVKAMYEGNKTTQAA